jgi:hypothetical protein
MGYRTPNSAPSTAMTASEWAKAHIGSIMRQTRSGKQFTVAYYAIGSRGNGAWFYATDKETRTYRKFGRNVKG